MVNAMHPPDSLTALLETPRPAWKSLRRIFSWSQRKTILRDVIQKLQERVRTGSLEPGEIISLVATRLFEKIWDVHGKALLGIAGNALSSRDDEVRNRVEASELANEFFFRRLVPELVGILKGVKTTKFESSRKFYAWGKVAMSRDLTKMINRLQRDPQSSASSLSQIGQVPASVPNPAKEVEENERTTGLEQDLANALNDLTTRERFVVVEHYIKKRPHKVLAEELGLDRPSCMNLLSKSLKKLRKMLVKWK